MRTLSFFVGIIALLSILSFSDKVVESLFWENHEKLSWHDYKGHTDHNHPHIAAITASSIIRFTGCNDKGELIYKITASFEKNQSWVRQESRTPRVLSHEQLHFDITELYARKLRKELRDITFMCDEEEAFHKYVDRRLVYWQADQLQYDFDTDFSNNSPQQVDWEMKVKNALEELSAYAELD